MIIHQQELGDQLGLIGFDNLLIDFVVLVRGAGDDDVHIRVLAVLILLLNEQRVAGRNQAVRHGVGAVDGGSGEIAQCRGQRVGRNRGHLDVVEVVGDILDFRRVARSRVNLDEARRLQQLDAAGEVRAVVRHAELKRSGRQRGSRGQGERGRRGHGDDFLDEAIHKIQSPLICSIGYIEMLLCGWNRQSAHSAVAPARMKQHVQILPFCFDERFFFRWMYYTREQEKDQIPVSYGLP